MLPAFGVFWIGEGLGITWPGADLSLIVFAAAFLAHGVASAELFAAVRREARRQDREG
jgi:uncharacterized membrane protein